MKYVRVYEANRVCICQTSPCKFDESRTPPKPSYRSNRPITDETPFIGQKREKSLSELDSTSLSKSSASSKEDNYYERSYISNLANYIKVLNLSDQTSSPKEELLDSPQSDYRTCIESFEQEDDLVYQSPDLDYGDFDDKAIIGANLSTLDDLINFLDGQIRSKSSVAQIQKEIVRFDPRTQLEQVFQVINRDLFNHSLSGVHARWSKTAIGCVYMFP